VAERDGALLAFVSFHALRREWALDLMRHRAGLPDGTMHALVHAGLVAAQAAGVPQMSLSAVPACPDPDRPIYRWAAAQIVTWAGGPGLRQFKSAFGPRWMPLYAAAPSPLSLSIVLADVALSVLRPVPPLGMARPGPREEMSRDHNEDEIYEVASSHAA
jgi:phosphatidylglycerol lysyltransferase